MNNIEIAKQIRDIAAGSIKGTVADNLLVLADKLDPQPKYGVAGKIYCFPDNRLDTIKVSDGKRLIFFDGSVSCYGLTNEVEASDSQIAARLSRAHGYEAEVFSKHLNGMMPRDFWNFVVSLTVLPATQQAQVFRKWVSLKFGK